MSTEYVDVSAFCRHIDKWVRLGVLTHTLFQCKGLSVIMVDIYSKSKRSEIMSRIKNRRTAPEEKVASLLRTLGVRFRRNVKSLPGQPDFVIRGETCSFVFGFAESFGSHEGKHSPDPHRSWYIRAINANL